MIQSLVRLTLKIDNHSDLLKFDKNTLHIINKHFFKHHAVLALSIELSPFGLPTPKKNEADERMKRTTAAIKVYMAIFSLS